MAQYISKLEEERIEDLAQQKAKKLGIPYIDLKTIEPNIEALKIIPESKAQQLKAVVFDKKIREFSVAAVNPEQEDVQQLIKEMKKFGTVNVFVASPLSLEHFLKNYQFIPKTRTAISGSITVTKKYIETIRQEKDPGLFLTRFFSENYEISEAVTWIIAYGVAVNASDLHLEPAEDKTILRYRIDGILYPTAEASGTIGRKINDRIKLISRINLNIRDVPQDGRFSIKLDEYDMEVRVSTIPGPNGENIVMRFLNPSTIEMKLEDLGMRDYDFQILSQEIKRPNGLILVTGPTGSGKTTTLYACLKRVATTENKVITIEDPIEYRLKGIEQTQVDAKSGYTFASGLRAILRQDPDIILIGEIRDQETAEIAMHASLTGHLVFSTLHTNNAAGAVPRLLDFKIKPEIISAALNLIIAQRLARKLCPNCSQEVPLENTLLEKIHAVLRQEAKNAPNLDDLLKIRIVKKPVGCLECGGKGYKGRIGIFEIILVDDKMQTLIHKNPDEVLVKNLALESGTVTLMGDALIKALLGITDLEEIQRIVGPII